MSLIPKLFSIVLIGIAVLFSGLFLFQFIDMITSDNRFLIFQILFCVVWLIGAGIFWMFGILTFKSVFKKKE